MVARVNRVVTGRTVEMTLSDGTELWAEGVRVGADSTWFAVVGRPSHVRAWQVDVGRAMPNTAIREISIRRHVRGGLEGAALGFLSGFALGLLAGARDSWIEPIDGGVVFGGAGLIGGLVYGALAGSKDVYDFTRAPGNE